MTLREHLRADENVSFALLRRSQRFLNRTFLLRAVAVNSPDPIIGESLYQRLLESFGSFAERFHGSAALRALFR
ncbi:hypothetical protein MnTg04_01773 [bacterium MnTg04]|nr:hypothetical protein MnTg04_01773 [bacterium MnTg04]